MMILEVQIIQLQHLVMTQYSRRHLNGYVLLELAELFSPIVLLKCCVVEHMLLVGIQAFIHQWLAIPLVELFVLVFCRIIATGPF